MLNESLLFFYPCIHQQMSSRRNTLFMFWDSLMCDVILDIYVLWYILCVVLFQLLYVFVVALDDFYIVLFIIYIIFTHTDRSKIGQLRCLAPCQRPSLISASICRIVCRKVFTDKYCLSLPWKDWIIYVFNMKSTKNYVFKNWKD